MSFFSNIYTFQLVIIWGNIPVMEQRSRSVGAFPEYWFIIPWLWALGAGILSVIALWNLRRRGSTVTIGETATPRPRSFAVSSGSIGCAWQKKKYSVQIRFTVLNRGKENEIFYSVKIWINFKNLFEGMHSFSYVLFSSYGWRYDTIHIHKS